MRYNTRLRDYVLRNVLNMNIFHILLMIILVRISPNLGVIPLIIGVGLSVHEVYRHVNIEELVIIGVLEALLLIIIMFVTLLLLPVAVLFFVFWIMWRSSK